MIMEFRTQFSEPLDVRVSGFSPSTVQPGMSPSISQMVRTRTVGGNLDEYQMNGIESDAPFDTEYPDPFDVADEIAALERGNAEKPPAEAEVSQNSSSSNGSSDLGENDE